MFEKEYTGTGTNPLYQWFWNDPVKNRQDPRLAQERDRKKVEDIGIEIANATLNLRALTGKEDALLVVPAYQYNTPMWWVSEISFLFHQTLHWHLTFFISTGKTCIPKMDGDSQTSNLHQRQSREE